MAATKRRFTTTSTSASAFSFQQLSQSPICPNWRALKKYAVLGGFACRISLSPVSVFQITKHLAHGTSCFVRQQIGNPHHPAVTIGLRERLCRGFVSTTSLATSRVCRAPTSRNAAQTSAGLRMVEISFRNGSHRVLLFSGYFHPRMTGEQCSGAGRKPQAGHNVPRYAPQT